jgi:hypothetical protein
VHGGDRAGGGERPQARAASAACLQAAGWRVGLDESGAHRIGGIAQRGIGEQFGLAWRGREALVDILPPIACHGGTRDSCSGFS